MRHVLIEIRMAELRRAQLQVQLQKPDIGRIHQYGAALRSFARQSGLAQAGGEVIDAALGNARQHRLDQGVIEKINITDLSNAAPIGEIVANVLQFKNRESHQSEIQIGDNSYLVKAKSIREENLRLAKEKRARE